MIRTRTKVLAEEIAHEREKERERKQKQQNLETAGILGSNKE